MLRLFLKKSYSLASNNRPLAAFQAIVPHTFSNDHVPDNKAVFGSYTETRLFHVKLGKLEYRASVAAQATPALDDRWFDDEKASGEAAGGGGNGEEGLEIAKIGISQEIVSALAGRGITNLFPIQKAVLEPAMKGRDMFGRARTGTGKTLAFGIPIMNRIIEFNAKHGRGRIPLALVLAPTRELARQVEKEFHESAPNLDTICVYGGTPISKQMRELDCGVDIVVGTPGRIIDLIKRGSLNLSEVQFVVLDEADQMLSVGFVDDVETIFQRLPRNRQSMLFSATMPSWIKNLIRNYLKDPLTIDLVGDSDKKLADGITLYSIASDMYGKAAILGPLITEHAKGGKCIVFTQTKRDADRLANALARSSFKCEALHGDISQAVRERTLSGFRNGFFNVLVATDVAARGLDVPNVDLVIHYEIPNCPETFVHRSGRTGRAGKTGTAILIYTQHQTREVRNIQQEVGCKFSELPRISSEGANMDMLNYMGDEGRPGSFGRDRSSRFSRFNRSDNYGSGDFGGSRNSRLGLSDGYNASGRFGYNRNPSGNFGGSGWGRPNAFEDFGSGRRSSFGDNLRQRNTVGYLGSGRSTGFGNYSSQNNDDSRSGSDGAFGFGDNSKPASRFGDFGGGKNENMKFSRTEL